MLKRNPLPIFFILTFTLTWAIWVPATLNKLNGGASILGPDNPVGQFGRWAPGIVALILTAIIAGKQGAGALFRPLKIWRVNIGWCLFALFFQPGLFFFSKLIDSLMGNTYDFVVGYAIPCITTIFEQLSRHDLKWNSGHYYLVGCHYCFDDHWSKQSFKNQRANKE